MGVELTEQDKDIVDAILNKDVEKGGLFFETYNVPFKQDSACMLIESKTDSVVLCIADGQRRHNYIQTIIDILSMLDYLQHNGLIYVVPFANHEFKECDAVLIQQGLDSIVNWTGCSYSHSAVDINVKSEVWTIRQSNSNELKGYRLPKELGKRIKSYFLSSIYSTGALCVFKNNNYRLESDIKYDREQLNFKKSLKAAWVAIGIAFVSILLSPILTTCIQNKHGYTTIEDSQYQQIDSLLQRIAH